MVKGKNLLPHKGSHMKFERVASLENVSIPLKRNPLCKRQILSGKGDVSKMDLFKFLDKYKEMPRGYKMFFRASLS